MAKAGGDERPGGGLRIRESPILKHWSGWTRESESETLTWTYQRGLRSVRWSLGGHCLQGYPATCQVAGRQEGLSVKRKVRTTGNTLGSLVADWTKTVREWTKLLPHFCCPAFTGVPPLANSTPKCAGKGILLTKLMIKLSNTHMFWSCGPIPHLEMDSHEVENVAKD